MNADYQEITNEVLNDKDLMARLEKAESSQEVSQILAEKGVNIAPEAIDEFMKQPLDAGELTEDDLEKVAGGSFKLRYLNPFYWVGRLIAWAVTNDMC